MLCSKVYKWDVSVLIKLKQKKLNERDTVWLRASI